MSIYTHGSALLLRHAFENDEMGLLPLLPFADSRASPAYSRRWSKRDGAREMESKSTIQSDAMS